MTEQEIKHFEEIINLAPKEDKTGIGYPLNYYNYLGLIPFSNYTKSNFTERFEYAQKELKSNLDNLNKAKNLIGQANSVLSNPQNKKQYDSLLKPYLENEIVRQIEFYVKKDKILDKDEEENLYEFGLLCGISKIEVKQLIEEQRKIYEFKDGTSSRQNSSATTSTKTGFPVLEIHNNAVYAKDKEFFFDNVKLSETRREIITIKNGGGGTLDAEAKYSAKWLEVSPKNIHQSKLPQDVSIIIDPSKDKSLKTGSHVMDTINLVYASGSGSTSVSVDVKLVIEGHYALLKRQTKYAVWVSSALALITLLYFFSNVNFSGWAIFGFVVSAIAIGLGAFAVAENEKNMGSLIIGGLILLITNAKIFALLFTVIITFYVAKYFFKRNPFKNEYIALIPFGSYILFWLFFLGTGGLYNNHNNLNYNHTNYPTNTNNYPETNTSTESINKTGYISAEQYANIRSGTSTSHNVLTAKNRGETVYVLERDKSTGWYKVDFGNGIGYVSDKLISFSSIAENNPQNTFTKQDVSNEVNKPSNSASISDNAIIPTDIISSNPNSILSNTKLRDGMGSLMTQQRLQYNTIVEGYLDNLFRNELNIVVTNQNLEILGFKQIGNNKFTYQYSDRTFTQKEIYNYIDINKAKVLLNKSNNTSYARLKFGSQYDLELKFISKRTNKIVSTTKTNYKVNDLHMGYSCCIYTMDYNLIADNYIIEIYYRSGANQGSVFKSIEINLNSGEHCNLHVFNNKEVKWDIH